MADIYPNKNPDQFKCEFYARSFTSKCDKGIHKRFAHPVQANERIPARVESRSVVPEEMELYAAAAAEAKLRNEKYQGGF